MPAHTLAWWFITRALSRDPDFVIGHHTEPYLRRWWIIPRNPLFNVYVHQILRSDDDRALHDHPWPNVSWLLAGSYTEVVPARRGQRPSADFAPGGVRKIKRYTDDVVFRWPWQSHRLEVTSGACWTLFITGPRVRRWGFRCAHGWRHWKIFTDPAAKGRVGRGCD